MVRTRFLGLINVKISLTYNIVWEFRAGVGIGALLDYFQKKPLSLGMGYLRQVADKLPCC